MSNGIITLYTRNILEDGTVDVTGTADTGYPESRLYDRSSSMYWKYTTGATKIDQFGFGEDDFGFGGDRFGFEYEEQQDIIIHCAQSSAIRPVDLLFIAGHNFDGRTILWQYSVDGGVTWSAAATWAQSGNGDIVKSLASAITARDWRVVVGMHVNPIAGECIMSQGRSFQALGNPTPSEQPTGNVIWSRSIGGLERSIKLGSKKMGWNMELRFNGDADLQDFRAAMDDLSDYSLPLLLKDINDEYYIMRLLSEPVINHSPPLRYYTTLTAREAE
ncbi:MAG: hypothetical protein SV375_00145 [Thermodesulfobacteriota bacterium]|nr:hypothetical protein [Thermodesulfobacteriota bacterium]